MKATSDGTSPGGYGNAMSRWDDAVLSCRSVLVRDPHQCPTDGVVGVIALLQLGVAEMI